MNNKSPQRSWDDYYDWAPSCKRVNKIVEVIDDEWTQEI